MTGKRSDNDWTRDLASKDATLREDAVNDLRDMLCRGLLKGLSRDRRVDAAFVEDVAQEACMKILEKLDGFEGRSKFRTWAVTIAVRTAVSKMRKRDWQNVSLASVTSDVEFAPRIATDSETSARTKCRSEMLNKLKELIDSELTEKQWTAITADLRGMPLPQIAEKLGSNTNSIYKLLHDARKKLKRGLENAGFTIDDVREAWAQGGIMALTAEQISRLLRKINQTRELEMTCPECLDELDRYTQSILDARPIDGIIGRVGEHLEACPCCTDQFKLVLATLQAIDES